MAETKMTISREGGDLRIEIGDGQSRNWITTDARGLEGLIRHLAEYRTTMVPEVPRTEPGALVGVFDPIFHMPSHPSAPERIVTIRHDGIGWLSFAFPQAAAKSLAAYLAAGVSDTPSPSPDRLN